MLSYAMQESRNSGCERLRRETVLTNLQLLTSLKQLRDPVHLPGEMAVQMQRLQNPLSACYAELWPGPTGDLHGGQPDHSEAEQHWPSPTPLYIKTP